MNGKLILPVILVSILLTGCLTTESIKQGKDLSTSGIAYTDAVDNLLLITVDNLIDFDSAELIKSRRGSEPRNQINEKNKALIKVLTELNRFRAQTKLLKTYFINLQALGDSPVKNDAGLAVKSLSDSISKLNKTFEGADGKELLSDDQKNQIGSLGGLVASTVHAVKIKNALKRDAEIIATYLALQEHQLENITKMLNDRFQAENDLFLNKEVITPYADKGKALLVSWSDKRKQWLKSQFVNQQLKTAKEAAKQLGGVWADILQGRSDINSISLLISDVNEFVTTIKTLKDAEEVANQ